MLDLKELEKKGYSEAALKAIFEQDAHTLKKSHPKVADLLDLHISRIDDGVMRSLARSREFWAIDKAYDVSQEQISHTLVKGLISKNVGPAELLNVAKDWGLDHMLTGKTDSSGNPIGCDGKRCDSAQQAYELHLPTFFTIYVPLVMAYHKARWAKLFNDRNVDPLYKLEPSMLSMERKLQTRIITSRIRRMTQDMGYQSYERDSIHNSLLYGVCMNFAEDSWFSESHVVNGKEVVTKSGVPFTIPHPGRTFWDLTKPLHTLNTDSGISYAGYWTIQRLIDVNAEPAYWNLKKIEIGSNSKWRSSGLFQLYQELYPCAAKFPDKLIGPQNDRIQEAFRYNYSSDKDSAIDVTVMFHRLVPKDWGLYDYDKPVWHRFVYAGCKIIHVKPFPYCPATVYQYDADGNRSRVTGIGLELLPYQDHMGNLLSQYLLSIKKNLARIVAYDDLILEKDTIDTLRNDAENALRGIQFVPYDGQELKNSGKSIANALTPLPLQAQNTQEVLNAITSLLSMVERALGFSPQEIGASASHQQSATEVITISNNTSQRLQLTGSFIDEAMGARAKMLYEAMLAYDSDEILAEVAELTEGGKEILKKLGFKIEEDGSHSVGVRGPKSALVLEGIGMFKDPSGRINEPKVAELMTTFFDRLISNQAIVQSVGVKFLFDRFNDITQWFQLPVDFRLPTDFKDASSPEAQKQAQEAQAQQQQAALAAMQQIAAEVSQQVVGQALQQAGQQIQEAVAVPLAEKQAQLEQALMGIMQQVQPTQEALAQIAQQTQATQAAVGQVAQQGQANQDAITQVAGVTSAQQGQIDQIAGVLKGIDQVVSGGGQMVMP